LWRVANVGVVDAQMAWWLLKNLTIVIVLCDKLVLSIISIMLSLLVPQRLQRYVEHGGQ
jgi:hypothetical protein